MLTGITYTVCAGIIAVITSVFSIINVLEAVFETKQIAKTAKEVCIHTIITLLKYQA